MVVDKPPGNEEVRNLLADPRFNFADTDCFVVRKFDTEIMSEFAKFYEWLEEQKNMAKEVLRNETGRTRLPKTPKRGNCMMKEEEGFRELRKKVLDSIMSEKKTLFANGKNVALCTPQTLKCPLRHTPIASKKKSKSSDVRKIEKTPTSSATKQLAQRQQTPYEGSKPSAMVFASDSPILTPGKKTTLKNMVTPKATFKQSTNKRSEVIRKMETRTKTVIKNKEEHMKEKAERARRDREERALRVKMNNERKEKEALEKLRISRLRDQQLEAIRQQQLAPSRPFSKSPCRTRGYYNRTQKPVIRSILSQHDVGPKNVFQGSEAKNENGEENVNTVVKEESGTSKSHGKRSLKSNAGADSKRQKLGGMDFCDESTNISCSTRSRTLPKVRSSQIHTTKIGEKGDPNSQTRGRSPSSMHTAIDFEEFATAKEESVLKKIPTSNIDKPKRSRTVAVVSDNVDHVAAGGDDFEAYEGCKENTDQQVAKDAEISIVLDDSVVVENRTFNMSISGTQKSDDEANNYNIDDISSNDETDDEDNPRKPVPLWARDEMLRQHLSEQILNPMCDVDTFFGQLRTPLLEKIFSLNRSRYAKRTSSAQWTSPLSQPKIGKSKYFELMNINRAQKP